MRTIISATLSRRLLLTGLSGIALASCSDIIGPSEAPKLYVLKPPMPPASSGAKVRWALSVQTPDASAGLDTDRIAISRPPARLDYYADAAWSDQLPALVQSAIVRAFETSGRIDAVAPDSDGARSDYILATELRDFEARYDQPDGAPVAVVHIGVRLIKASSRDIIGRFDATQEVPAAMNSIDAAVEALDTALSHALGQIVDWALNAAPPVK